MTPTEKCDRAMAIAQKRLAQGDIRYAAYSAIVARAKAERDGKPAPKGPFADMIERHRKAKASTKSPAPSPSAKPTPRAKRELVADDEPESKPISAADMAVVRAAIVESKRLRAAAAEPDSFAHRVEAARALAEGRAPRTDLADGPEQPDHTPMNVDRFTSRVARARALADGDAQQPGRRPIDASDLAARVRRARDIADGNKGS